MLRNAAVWIGLFSVTTVSAEEFQAVILKVDGNKIVMIKRKITLRGENPGPVERVTLTAVEGCKVFQGCTIRSVPATRSYVVEGGTPLAEGIRSVLFDESLDKPKGAKERQAKLADLEAKIKNDPKLKDSPKLLAIYKKLWEEQAKSLDDWLMSMAPFARVVVEKELVTEIHVVDRGYQYQSVNITKIAGGNLTCYVHGEKRTLALADSMIVSKDGRNLQGGLSNPIFKSSTVKAQLSISADGRATHLTVLGVGPPFHSFLAQISDLTDQDGKKVYELTGTSGLRATFTKLVDGKAQAAPLTLETAKKFTVYYEHYDPRTKQTSVLAVPGGFSGVSMVAAMHFLPVRLVLNDENKIAEIHFGILVSPSNQHFAQITSVDGMKVTFKKPFTSPMETMTLTAADNLKVLEMTFDLKKRTFELAPVAGGLKSLALANAIEDRSFALVVVNADNRITEIRVRSRAQTDK